MVKLNREYENYECVKNMGEDYLEKFQDLVKHYGPKLSKNLSKNGSIYTMHDFEHHCCDLFKIISNVILNVNLAYDDTTGLKRRELYILNTGVLLHDMGMNKAVDMNRDTHSYDSAEFVRKEYKEPTSALAEEQSGLTVNEIKGIRNIVEAHSDGKRPEIPECQRGLNNPRLEETLDGRHGEVHEMFLAYILRMADELDVTSNRIGQGSVEKQLENAEEVIQKLEKQLESCDSELEEALKKRLEECMESKKSLTHWKRLYLFREIKREAKEGQAYLIVDDEYVEQRLEAGDSIQNLADEINRVFLKIQTEFLRFEEYVNSNLFYSGMVGMKKILVSTSNEALRKKLQKKAGLKGIDISKEEGEEEKSEEIGADHGDGNMLANQEDEKEEVCVPTVISKKMNERLEEFIDDRDLYKVGHFLLQGDLCARDWIDIDEVIETEGQFRQCIGEFVRHIQGVMGEKEGYTVIGLDVRGMLIASRIAYILHRPFSYLVPAKSESNSTSEDNECHVEGIDRLVLVVDAVATYGTIQDVINRYGIRNRVDAIYAIFFRNTCNSIYVRQFPELVKKTYVLNDSFSIEIFNNRNCKYKGDKKCKALNKKIH